MAFVERLKQESMYGLSAKKVTVVERLKQESMYGLSAKKETVVERFKQESMYGLSAKKSGRWRGDRHIPWTPEIWGFDFSDV